MSRRLRPPVQPTTAPARRAAREGKALAPAVRADFAQRFGHDFGAVRIHDDATAHASAHSMGAAAYTHGQDVFFAAGRYKPETATGRALLAHELAHTVQQRGGGGAAPGAAAEREAHRAATAVALDGAMPAMTATAPAVAMQPARQSAGTAGKLAAIEGWSYIVYASEIKLRFFRKTSADEAKRRAERNLPGFVQVGTIPWITNNPGNIDYLPSSPSTSRQGVPRTLGALGNYGGRHAIFGSDAQGAQAIGAYLTRMPGFGTHPNLGVGGAIKQFKGEEPHEKAAREAREQENAARIARGEKPLPAIDVREDYLRRVREIMRRRMMEAEALEGGEELNALTPAQRRAVQDQVDARLTEFMARPAKDVPEGDATLAHAVGGIRELEGRAAAPGVTFTCAGFDDPRGRAAYDGEQRRLIQALLDSPGARGELAALLGCAP